MWILKPKPKPCPELTDTEKRLAVAKGTGEAQWVKKVRRDLLSAVK